MNHIKTSVNTCIQKIRGYLDNIDHIKTSKSTYFKHMTQSLLYSSQMLLGSMSLIIHSIFPGSLTHVGSNVVKRLYFEMNERKVLSVKTD